jgi:hypothetical protein
MTEQSLDDGVYVKKRIESVCEESRVMMFVLDRLCLHVFLSILGGEK